MNDRQFGAVAATMWFVALVINFVLWGSLIYFGFWCANHFGLIS